MSRRFLDQLRRCDRREDSAIGAARASSCWRTIILAVLEWQTRAEAEGFTVETVGNLMTATGHRGLEASSKPAPSRSDWPRSIGALSDGGLIVVAGWRGTRQRGAVS